MFAIRMMLLCHVGRFILLVRSCAPCQTVVELEINRDTPGRTVIERGQTANTILNSP